jgi:hypothetical protein
MSIFDSKHKHDHNVNINDVKHKHEHTIRFGEDEKRILLTITICLIGVIIFNR